jgi:hypothetical protein
MLLKKLDYVVSFLEGEFEIGSNHKLVLKCGYQ